MYDLDQVPVLAPSLGSEPMDAHTLVLYGEREHLAVTGPHLAEVASWIDGRRSVMEIIDGLGGTVGDLQVMAALQQLESAGVLLPRLAGQPAEATAFWHAVGVPVVDAFDRLARSQVTIKRWHEGLPCMQAIVDVMAAAGLQVSSASSEPSEMAVDVHLTDDYTRSELAALNREHLSNGRWWCLAKPVGRSLLLGPIFRPGNGPCWDCLSTRLRANESIRESIRRKRGVTALPAEKPAFLPATQQLALNLLAVTLAQALAAPTRPVPLWDHVAELDCRTLQLCYHRVVARPQCPSCGDPQLTNRPRVIALSPVPKCAPHEGGYRRQLATDTLTQYEHLVSPLTGAVSYLHAMPGCSSALRAVYVSGYPALPGGEHKDLRDGSRVCAGKGRSHAQARASALCEAIERRSGEWNGEEPHLRASLRELGPAALSPQHLTGFSERQYERRQEINRVAHDRAQRVPEPLGRDTPIEWTPAWSLSAGEQRQVPLSYCYSGTPAESGSAFCPPTGNGVAAGTCLEEAILQGLFELVERDAVAIWWYQQIRRPTLDLSTSRDPYVAALLADYEKRQVSVRVLDLTHDLRIPTYVAVAVHPGQLRRVSLGFGCHLDGSLALERALTELNQLGDGLRPSSRAPFVDVDPDSAFLRPLESTVAHLPPSWCGANLLADIDECRRRLEGAGLELIVVDKTRLDLGLSVAQVIVPGLRHFWPRFAPGRLYDVPVRLGWLTAPKTELQLNPVPLLL